ncbi:MAG TPA: hypothetical protein VFT69_04305 [Pseudolabrys sp.]|jgi:hypothetical protein|nr:hypothetical protein [Pseudolabrys sp.]
MPLSNRVSPFGELFASPARGMLMGNRGGKFHIDDKKLATRRWVSRQWICCVLDFKDRHRDVWGRYYTELFFLDEVTAFAAGHRPCFECRRKHAEEFAWLFSGSGKRAIATAMDKVLHAERLAGKGKRTHCCAIDDLPDGVMAVRDGQAFAVRGSHLLHWTPSGYDRAIPRPRGSADVLTPPAILAVLARGYSPLWHPSAASHLAAG